MRVKLPMGDVLRLGLNRRPTRNKPGHTHRWFGLTFVAVGENWGTVRYLAGLRVGR